MVQPIQRLNVYTTLSHAISWDCSQTIEPIKKSKRLREPKTNSRSLRIIMGYKMSLEIESNLSTLFFDSIRQFIHGGGSPQQLPSQRDKIKRIHTQ